LLALVRHFGPVVPILVDPDRVIIDGHAVHAALAELGYDEIAVVIARNREPAEIRALRLALNRLPQDAGWDDDPLRQELQSLLDLGFDMELTGFDPVEIDMALAIDEPGAGVIETEPADALMRPTSPIVRSGDVYRLGRHTIACGDARDHDLLFRLAAGRNAQVVFTDPPYNVPIGGFVSGLGKTRHREFAMASGEMSRKEFTSFLASFVGATTPVLVDGAILYICMDWRHLRELLEAAEQHQLEQKNLCLWVKSNAGMGTFYRSQHELIAVFKHGSAQHQNNFELGQHGRSRSNVWTYRGLNTFATDRMDLLAVHPTIKPVQMIADAPTWPRNWQNGFRSARASDSCASPNSGPC
jgi:hypothetical protein